MAQMIKRGRRFSHLLSRELKGAISAYGFTVRYVVEEMGVDYSTLSRYFNGSRALPASTFTDVCEIIGASPSDLVERAYNRLIQEMGEYSTTDNRQATQTTKGGGKSKNINVNVNGDRNEIGEIGIS